jgi:hypothetical protein
MMLLRQGDSALDVLMRKIHLLPFLCLTLFASGARAQGVQNKDIFFLFGANSVNPETIPGSQVTVSGSTSYWNFSYGYGYQVLRKSAASLWVEYVPVFAGNNRVGTSTAGTVSQSWWASTVGVRFMVPLQSRVSIYGATGGGGGSFHEVQAGAGATPVVTSPSTWHGVFDIGGGIDVRLSRRFSIRAELRDWVTGAGLSGIPGRNHPLAFGGVALHF